MAAAPSENLNDAQGLVAVLPAELVADIFRLLDWPGRLTVSHVCASWRRAALADPFLWSEYTVPTRGTPELCGEKATDALIALLGRSRPLPLRLYCKDEVPSAVIGLVFAHMEMIGTLNLGAIDMGSLQRLQELAAPLLTDFACRWTEPRNSTPWHVPVDWASHIQHLDIHFACVWPNDCVFSMLRSLSGVMPGDDGFGAPLVDYFPNIQRLSLFRVTHPSLSYLTSLPPALTKLSLGTDSFAGVDCAELLRSWMALGLQQLCIYQICTSRSALEAYRLFTRACTGPWSLRASGVFMTLWAEPYQFDFACTARGWLVREPGILSCWGQLRELDLTWDDFIPFRTSISPGLVLPILACARFNGISGGGQLDAASIQCVASIETPALRLVELFTLPEFTDFANVVRVILRTFHVPVPLETLAVYPDQPDSYGRESFTALRDVVDCVKVRSSRNAPGTIFDMRDER